MVEPVSYSTGKARLQRVGNDAGPTPGTATGASAGATAAGIASLGGASDMLSISAAAKGMPSELKAGPPIDMDAVDRIRVAISENRYPVDLKAITEALFQNFLEITS
jgi:negative regulator of flagellin synthesis FlgM